MCCVVNGVLVGTPLRGNLRNHRPVKPADGICRRRVAEVERGIGANEIRQRGPVYQVARNLNVPVQPP